MGQTHFTLSAQCSYSIAIKLFNNNPTKKQCQNACNIIIVRPRKIKCKIIEKDTIPMQNKANSYFHIK